MKILIAHRVTLFEHGFADKVVDVLSHELVARGHQVEGLRLPAPHGAPAQEAPQLLLASRLRVENTDHLIALDVPAHLISHPSKTVWILTSPRRADFAGADAEELIRGSLAVLSEGRVHAGSVSVQAELREDAGLACDVVSAPPVESARGPRPEWDSVIAMLLP